MLILVQLHFSYFYIFSKAMFVVRNMLHKIQPYIIRCILYKAHTDSVITYPVCNIWLIGCTKKAALISQTVEARLETWGQEDKMEYQLVIFNHESKYSKGILYLKVNK